MSEKRRLVNHPSLSPDVAPVSFWHQFVELGRSHSDVFRYILGKLPGMLEWVKLLRQVDRGTRDVVSPAVKCIVHSRYAPRLKAQLDDVFPAACQLRIGNEDAGPEQVGLFLDSFASMAPPLMCKLQEVTVICNCDGIVSDSGVEDVDLEQLTAPLAAFLSRCANSQTGTLHVSDCVHML
jgi:hypothetical protein